MYVKKSHSPSTVTDSLMVTQRANLTVIKTTLSLPSEGCLRLSERWCKKKHTALCENVAFLKITLQSVLWSDCGLCCWTYSDSWEHWVLEPGEGGLGDRQCSPDLQGALAARAKVQDCMGRSTQAATTTTYTKSLLIVL